eukprot:scaffold10728_cov64-Phaeocystis_antarctica.AAC.12
MPVFWPRHPNPTPPDRTAPRRRLWSETEPDPTRSDRAPHSEPRPTHATEPDPSPPPGPLRRSLSCSTRPPSSPSQPPTAADLDL